MMEVQHLHQGGNPPAAPYMSTTPRSASADNLHKYVAQIMQAVGRQYDVLVGGAFCFAACDKHHPSSLLWQNSRYSSIYRCCVHQPAVKLCPSIFCTVSDGWDTSVARPLERISPRFGPRVGTLEWDWQKFWTFMVYSFGASWSSLSQASLWWFEMICNNSRTADEKTLMPNFLFQDENHPEKPPSQNGRCGVMCTILRSFTWSSFCLSWFVVPWPFTWLSVSQYALLSAVFRSSGSTSMLNIQVGFDKGKQWPGEPESQELDSWLDKVLLR